MPSRGETKTNAAEAVNSEIIKMKCNAYEWYEIPEKAEQLHELMFGIKRFSCIVVSVHICCTIDGKSIWDSVESTARLCIYTSTMLQHLCVVQRMYVDVLRQANQETGFFYAFFFLILAVGLLLLMIAAQSYRRHRPSRRCVCIQFTGHELAFGMRARSIQTNWDYCIIPECVLMHISDLNRTSNCLMARQTANGYFVWNFTKLLLSLSKQ